MILLHQSSMRDDDLTYEIVYDGRKSEPEIRLLSAMLARAIQDATGNVGSLTLDEVKRHKREAIYWLTEAQSDVAQEFSFPWVCNWLNLDYLVVKRRIKELLAIGEPVFFEGQRGVKTRS